MNTCGTLISAATWLPAGRLRCDSRQGQWLFSIRHRAKTGSGVHKNSYPKGTGGSFTGGIATWKGNWYSTSI